MVLSSKTELPATSVNGKLTLSAIAVSLESFPIHCQISSNFLNPIQWFVPVEPGSPDIDCIVSHSSTESIIQRYEFSLLSAISIAFSKEMAEDWDLK